MNDVGKGKLKVKKLEKQKMLSMRITQGVQFHARCTLGKGDELDKVSHGQDEGKYEKDESCR